MGQPVAGLCGSAVPSWPLRGPEHSRTWGPGPRAFCVRIDHLSSSQSPHTTAHAGAEPPSKVHSSSWTLLFPARPPAARAVVVLTRRHRGALTTHAELPPAPGKQSFLKHPTPRLGWRLACGSLLWLLAQVTMNCDKLHAVILTVLESGDHCGSHEVKSRCEQGWSLSHSHSQLHSLVHLSEPPPYEDPARTLGPQCRPYLRDLDPTRRVSLPCEVTCLQVPWIGGESLCGSLFSPPQSTPPLNLLCPRPPWGQDTVCIAFEAAGAASPWDWTISDFHRSHGKHLLSARCVPGLLQGGLTSAAALWSSVPGEGPGSYHEVISTP